MVMHWRPRSHMEQLPLTIRVILQQRINMLPARQRAYSPKAFISHIQQRVASAITKNGTLHMRRLKLAALYLDLSILGYDTLGNVERSVIILRESQDDVDFVLGGTFANLLHFR